VELIAATRLKSKIPPRSIGTKIPDLV
jgi:hypothetical protein